MTATAERTRRVAGVALALALLLAVGAADYWTGHELLFSSFYLLAVGVAAWNVGAAFGVIVALLSVGTWVVGDFASGAEYTKPFVLVWNAGIILAFYLVVVALLTRLRGTNRVLEVRVRERTSALTDEMAERERLEREVLDVGERERRRIGRDLHDSLGQLLTGTALAGQVLNEKLAARTAPEAADARRIVGLVEEAIDQTRRFARGLDPVEVEGGGLEQGLRELVARTSELGSLRCTFECTGPVGVADSVTATHLYRIAQEAITNAVRHGAPQSIAVALAGLPGRVRLTVRDDGHGFDPATRGTGMGLRIMAHRVDVMGGTFEVRRAPERGILVSCEVPNP